MAKLNIYKIFEVVLTYPYTYQFTKTHGMHNFLKGLLLNGKANN